MIAAFALAGCTSTNVKPLPPTASHVCIQENAKVEVSDFVDVLRDGFDRHGVDTEVFAGIPPASCEFILTYTARRSWHFAPYLSKAELHIETSSGHRVASAEYHLRMGGGFSLMKWEGTKSKMDPIIDELLKGYQGSASAGE